MEGATCAPVGIPLRDCDLPLAGLVPRGKRLTGSRDGRRRWAVTPRSTMRTYLEQIGALTTEAR